MKKYYLLMVLPLLLGLLISPSTAKTVDAEVQPDQASLTIYTYESLLADPGYDWTTAFEQQHPDLDNGSVEVVYLPDAGSIVNRAAAEKDSPVADVLIGIDNVLVHKARDLDILQPYTPSGSENLIDGLADGLASDFLLTPYDYGVISLWYLENRMELPMDPVDFTLSDLIAENMTSNLIVEDPTLSSPGLGFLLSTIAIYGDEDAGIDGIADGSWEDFWRELSVDTRMTSSWGNAIDLMYQEEAGRPMMVSYASSPAYGSCLFNDTSTEALLSHENGTQWGWQQIEGLGIVKDTPNQALAQDFVDWFISAELQEQIHQNQWIYPAREGIPAPDCYSEAINPDTITPLNDQISQSTLAQHLESWLDTWETAWVEGPVSGNGDGPVEELFYEDILSISPFYFLGFLALIPINYKRRN